MLVEEEQALGLTNIQNPTSNIRRRLRRLRFPAAMEPQPLIGILADHSFEMRVKDLRIERGVTGDRQRRGEIEGVPPLFSSPKPQTREYCPPPHAPRFFGTHRPPSPGAV